MPPRAHVQRQLTVQRTVTGSVQWSLWRSLISRLQISPASSDDADIVLQLIDHAISKDDKQSTSMHPKRLKRLRSYYVAFKQRSSLDVSQLLCFWTIHQENTLAADTLEFPHGQNFQDCMTEIIQWEEHPAKPSIFVRAILAQSNPDDLSAAFGFRQKMWASVRFRIRDLYKFPSRLVSIAVHDAWNEYTTDGTSFSDSATKLLWENEQQPILPSQRRVPPAFCWNPGLEGTLTLRWQADSPRFRSDLDVFIWQRHCHPPEWHNLDLCFFKPDVNNDYRVLLSFNSGESLRLFQRAMTSRLQDTSEPSPPLRPSIDLDTQPWSPFSEQLFCFLAATRVIVGQISGFLQRIREDVVDLKYHGRKYPSSSKIRHLVHLHDLCDQSEHGLNHTSEVFSQVSGLIGATNSTDLWSHGITWNNRFSKIATDINFLLEQHEVVKGLITARQQMIRDHLALEQDRRTFTLTVLAAIFLPLSFIAGIFGMNLQVATPPELRSLSTFENDTLANVTDSDSRATTQLLLASLGPDGNRLFKFRDFWIIGGSLILLIPLVMFAGQLVRWSYRTAARYVIYWRTATILVVLAAWCGFYAVLPLYRNRRPVSLIYYCINIGLVYSVCFSRSVLAWNKRLYLRLWLAVFFICIAALTLHGYTRHIPLAPTMMPAWWSIYRAWDYGWLNNRSRDDRKRIELSLSDTVLLLLPFLKRSWLQRLRRTFKSS